MRTVFACACGEVAILDCQRQEVLRRFREFWQSEHHAHGVNIESPRPADDFEREERPTLPALEPPPTFNQKKRT